MPKLASCESIGKNTRRFKLIYDEITCLAQYFNPLTKKGCLTVVDNLSKIEVPPIAFPIMLRTTFNLSWIGPLTRYFECKNYTTGVVRNNKSHEK